MKKRIPFFAIIVLFCLSACTQTKIQYSIKRSDIVMGSHLHYEWILVNDSVKVVEYPMNSEPARVLCSEALTSEQAGRLQKILHDIDLSKMEDNYFNNEIDGEGNSEYDITINGVSKHIYVYFVDVSELMKINTFFNDATAGKLD
ncbi:MAG: hypothetical protein CVU11_14940 [Bacteroidetes bacterium HGW-Bacteroidetes-6]|jgi:hypothetical protein|nr:MAG: hypothetical protein CVU11_14940 [Bacteroidetes bacterium HGW-Bacteroidetes-6]